MKKYLIIAVVIMSFISIAPKAQAAVVCDSPDHAIWSNDNSEKVGCITAANWDAAMAQAVNQADQKDFINVVRGQSLITTSGQTDTCPTWFPMNCVIKKALFSRFI